MSLAYECARAWRLVFLAAIVLLTTNQPKIAEAQEFTTRIDEQGHFVDGSGFIPTFNWDASFNFDEYELGPGDILNFHMSGGRQFNGKVYISTNFELMLPFVGSINVKGVRLGQLPKIVNEKLATVFKNSTASIALQHPREFMVRLSGAVANPGSKPTNALLRLNDFFAKYGPLKPNASQIEIHLINSRLKTSRTIDYQSFLLKGDQAGNPFLTDGDEISIPFQRNVVIVTGDILRPGQFEFSEQSLPLKTIVEDYLGGLSKAKRVGGEVTINRQNPDGRSQTLKFEHAKFFDPKTAVNYYNFQVQTGDLIHFPTQSAYTSVLGDKVFITGEIKLPGALVYIPGTPLNGYISASGGTTPRANLSGIRVYKASGETVPNSPDLTIDPGDTIFIPEVTFKFWQDHVMILSTFLGLAATVIAVSATR